MAKIVRIAAILSVFSLLTLPITSCSSTTASTTMMGQSVPYVRFQALDGTWHVIDEFKGKDIVLVFWASWCSKSRATMQSLNTFAHRSSSRDDRVFIAVNIDKPEDEARFRKFIADVPIDAFLHSYSGNEVYDEAYVRMNGEELPQIFVLDKSGTVRAVGHSDSVVFDYFGEIRD